MNKLYIDIETYSDVDLKKHGLSRYLESDEHQILMAAYALNDDPVQVLFGEDVLKLPGLLEETIWKVAHNAPFEILNFAKELGYGFEETVRFSHFWDDTEAKGAQQGYPKALADMAKAVGATDKDSSGTLLINWFCKPDRNGGRRLPEDHPEKWADFIKYAVQDVETMREIDKKLDWWQEGERETWLLDFKINLRGLAIDTELVDAALAASDKVQRASLLELFELTLLDNPNSVAQLGEWLRENGSPLPDMRAKTVREALGGELPPEVRRALELRQMTSLSSVKKFEAADLRVSSDGRLRNSLAYFGAHTGRWAGRGMQLQNLPRGTDGFDADAVADRLKKTLEADPEELKSLVRGSIIGPFSVVDYSGIEARVLAWLAGESWVTEYFAEFDREKEAAETLTGDSRSAALQALRAKDFYNTTAARMGPEFVGDRDAGKVAALALGYQGWINALKQMGWRDTDEKARVVALAWRAANPNIVKYWAAVEAAMVNSVYGPQIVGKVNFASNGEDVRVLLPSGRKLYYRKLQVTGEGRSRRITFFDPTKKIRVDTYGGKLVENITQAVARDLLRDAMLRLETEGFSLVSHVHDEVIVDNPGNEDNVHEIEKLMADNPLWASGLPLAAEGFKTFRYKK